ncbi:uncharacterized protein ppp1r18 isoform X2 [Stigmatopora nigra]
MSISSLPEWKQLLLERKRREEEERERREKEEEEKFSKMPAWKRGIIQRRKAKQEILVDREKERDLSIPLMDAQPIVDILNDTDNWVTVSQGNEQFLNPDLSQSPDVDLKTMSQVSVETIVPVHENPFMLTQNVWRKGKDDVVYQERSSELEIQEREKDKLTSKSHDGENGRGRKIEKKIEKFRDLSEGRDKEKNRDRSQGRENNKDNWEKGPCKESVNDVAKEKEMLKEENAASSFSPLVPCLRTIRADNIIIIEQNRGGSDENRSKWREMEAERPEEDLQGKRGMKMDLREILAGGASVTEIRASDVLIIKPTVNSEERTTAGGGGKGLGRDDIEICTMEAKMENWCREFRSEMSWTREKEISKEKDRPCSQVTVSKDNKKDSLDDNVFYERGGRVSQLLSKFGEFRKPPSRSKSSDNFLRPGRWKNLRENDDRNEERTYDGRNVPVKGVPKRSFSFSDRIVSSKENGLDQDGWKPRERIHSDRSGTSYGKEIPVKCKMGSSRFLEKEQFVKRKNGNLSNENQSDAIERKNDTGVEFRKRTEDKKLDLVEKTATATQGEEDIEGFMMASIKTTEGISFARRIPIRQDGKARTAEKDIRKPAKKAFKLDLGAEKDSYSGIYSEGQIREEFDESESCIHRSKAENCFKLESDHKESSNLLSTVADRGEEWDLLSHHTEELIHKIEKVVDGPDYNNDRSEKSYNKQGVHNDSVPHDVNLRPPKGIATVGIPPGPLEIQIPRTVFYVAEEMAKKKTTSQSMEVKKSEGGKGVERKDSWRAGKPLSRVESLREKIRQREQESLRQKTSQGINGVDVKIISDGMNEGDTHERGGSEKEKELEPLTPLQNSMLVAGDKMETKTEVQTSGSAFDTMQEVDVLKNCPQLPVSVLNSTTVSGEEVSSSLANAPFEDSNEGLQISKDKRETLKHVEEQVTHCKGQDQGGEGGQVEDTKDPEEGYKSSIDSAQPRPHSPPHPNSLAAMSRIYNLETVGSRSGLCLRERNMDVSSVHLVKVKPLVTSDALKGDAKLFSSETCGNRTRQLQLEQLQHKEQESVQTQNIASTSITSCKDRDAKGRQSKGLKKHQAEETIKETQEVPHKVCPRRVFSPTSQLKQPNPIIASHIRSQSPDKSLKPSDSAPTPASSPCSSSPSASPSPSPTFFCIRSASGGQVKRGATITITPKKSTGTERTIGTPTPSIPVTSVNTKIPQLTPQTQTSVAEPVQKKYPTVDEIEVIGGYQNLEKSCLIRTKGPPKRGKVCFDENKLEQVCEYPSETSMLVSTPFPQDLEKTEMLPGEEPKEEEGEADVRALMSKSPKNLGTALGRVLRVDESCPR